MGASSALHVNDSALVGADLGLTAETLAAAVRRVEPDLVIVGNQSTDGVGGVMAAMVAEHLDMPHVTNLSAVVLDAQKITGVRINDYGSMSVAADLPAVISITEALPDGRFPNFKGIMAAKKKPIETVSLVDLGVDAEDQDSARSIMIAIGKRPGRQAGVKIVDEGDAGNALAAFLLENRLV